MTGDLVNNNNQLSLCTRNLSFVFQFSSKPNMQNTHFKTFNCNTQVDSWQDANTGFESLLKSREGRRLFEDFLKKEFSSENIQVSLIILVIFV